MEINEVKLVETCAACPEQYDAFFCEELVGYLRLRHGYFYTSCPDVDGEVVYEAETKGDGMFMDDEKYKHLSKACEAIREWVTNRAAIDVEADKGILPAG